MRTPLRPEMTRRARWALLLMVPLIVLAIVLHSAALTPLVGIVVLVTAAWALQARR